MGSNFLGERLKRWAPASWMNYGGAAGVFIATVGNYCMVLNFGFITMFCFTKNCDLNNHIEDL